MTSENPKLPIKKLFVYGTLKKGHYNHGNLHGSTFIGNAVLPGFLLVDLGPFPAAVQVDVMPRNGLRSFNIHGEVYEVSKEVLDRCDELEGVPEFYNRLTVSHPIFGDLIIYAQEREKILRKGKPWVPSGIWEPGGKTRSFIWDDQFLATDAPLVSYNRPPLVPPPPAQHPPLQRVMTPQVPVIISPPPVVVRSRELVIGPGVEEA